MLPFSLCVALAAWRQTELGWSHLSNVVRVCAPAAEPEGIGGMMAVFPPKASNMLLNSSNTAVRICSVLYVCAKQINSSRTKSSSAGG